MSLEISESMVVVKSWTVKFSVVKISDRKIFGPCICRKILPSEILRN